MLLSLIIQMHVYAAAEGSGRAQFSFASYWDNISICRIA